MSNEESFIRGKIDSDAEKMEILHLKTGWTPGKAQLRPSEQVTIFVLFIVVYKFLIS